MVSNPYSHRSCIKNPTAFFGRAAQLESVLTFIRTPGKACVSFVGGPFAGLSSLLSYIVSDEFSSKCRLATNDLKLVHVDSRLYDDPLPLLRFLLARLAPDRPVPNVPNWRALNGRLIATLSGLYHARIVFLFDDFEHIGLNEGFDALLDTLRSLAADSNLMLITATHRYLYDCCSIDLAKSPFPNIFTPLHVGAFTDEETRDFIASNSARSGVDLTPFVSRIVELGGRYPYFLQLACWHYHEALVHGGAPDHARIARQFAHEARPAFERIWAWLKPDERETLRAIARGHGVADQGIGETLRQMGLITAEEEVFCRPFRGYISETT